MKTSFQRAALGDSLKREGVEPPYLPKVTEHMADKEAERIKFETELLKLTVLIAIATGGGSVSLLLGELSLPRVILAAAGLLVTIGFTGAA